MSKGPYYITTAIAYTSGKPHIGNTYEIVLADAIARYKRAQGYDVYFQTGTDEHGQKIEEKADAAGVTPKEFVDGVAAQIREIWDLMDTSYDKFIRTTDSDHERQVQKIFKKLYDQGDIYKGYYEGLYCTPCESFFTESQLVDGQAPLIGEEVDSESYFADAKLTRQRSRDEAAAALKDMLSQADLDTEQKTIYTLQATQLAQSIETEGKIENLIKAKGFEDVMVYCDSTRVDVVVKTDGLDTAQVAQLKDIILKETDVEAENISIVEVK